MTERWAAEYAKADKVLTHGRTEGEVVPPNKRLQRTGSAGR
jgi:hypothetical protein